MGRIQTYSMINCAVNPQAARERVTAYEPVARKKRVLIAGGGVAGCEAARVLAERGHEPVLYEASERLGGNLLPGGAPAFKEDDLQLVKWYENELERLRIPVYLNTRVTKEMVLESDCDAVIVATGSRPKMFSLGDDEKVYCAEQVLMNQKDPGDRVVVVGGGLVGCEMALDLAQKGKKVTILEALPKIMAVNGPICSANKEMLEELLPFHGVNIICNAKVTGFKDGAVSYETAGKAKKLDTDSVILSVGYRSADELYHELEFDVADLYLLGDAGKVSNIMYAIWDAFEVANHI